MNTLAIGLKWTTRLLEAKSLTPFETISRMILLNSSSSSNYRVRHPPTTPRLIHNDLPYRLPGNAHGIRKLLATS
jgi:hypothetical protein